jgi:putative transposase
VKTLMKRMGIEALYRHPWTTKPEPGHKIYPYLLRRMEIVRPNQVWARRGRRSMRRAKKVIGWRRLSGLHGRGGV